ncbi:MAG: hypothetical protein ACI4J2_02685 [Ruminococcus sp.]
MKYFFESENKENVPVHIESVSPTGNYFVGWHTEARSSLCLYRKLRETDDEVYGEKLSECSGSSDEGTGFKGVVWYEEYGFVKVIFRCWCTMDTESVRLFFDRELYEKKKKELHGSK